VNRIMIIGASSAIAHATARLFAREGGCFYLVGRDENRLRAVADDLKVMGATKTEIHIMDVLDYERHDTIITEAVTKLDGLDTVLIAHGELPNQRACEGSFKSTRISFEVNCLSTLSILTHIANRFEKRKSGTIVVISSVAGDKGRRSNYIYGASKGALTIFLQGLTARLREAGVTVTTVKPGYVDTPMTSSFTKNFLWAQPNRVAQDIYRAIEKGKEEVYTPWFWKYIMWVLDTAPAFVLRRFNL
jgi:short-subunit dehydrogenase